MSMIGTRVVRNEDPALLTTGGKYVDDLAPPHALHATFVRSDLAHATIISIDKSEAESMPGVVGVYTAADLELSAAPPAMPMLNQDMLRSWMATDRVRFVGEMVAVVISETRETGVDAAELVFVDYEPLDALVSMRDAANDKIVLFPEAGTNTVFGFPAGDDEIFGDSEVTVHLTFRLHRLSVAAIEPRAGLAEWTNGRLTYWACTQFPHSSRDTLAAAMGVDVEQVHVITPDVGGGFGGKNARYPEDMVIASLARTLDRPVRWTETRSESMVGLAHGRGVEFDATLGGSRDGRINAYRLHIIQDAGAYPAVGAVLPMFGKIMACGVYDIDKVEVSAQSVVTNTAVVGAYRGAGRPEATAAIERMMDRFAAEIGIDPAEVRRRNLIQPDQFPYQTQTGANMDSGEYEKALDLVIADADYAGLRAEQERRRNDPSAPLLGLGWSTYVEITNPMGESEFGAMELRSDGSALVLTGSSSHGQGHHTAFAQLASSVTGIPFDRIEVRHGDTDEVKRGGGTGGSRSLQTGGSAVVQASESVVELAKEVAATMLEANVDDIVLDAATGSFSVAGTPARSLEWTAIAANVAGRGGENLAAEIDFKPPAATFPFGAHLSVVEVDRDTGAVTALRHIACDDAGVLVNPMIVDGQVHGGLASGIAHALMEEFIYDDDGNPLTANFMDYAIASAAELPSFERIELETPTDRNPLGAKGIGESGTIGATPAVQNAVIDALSHLGVRHIEVPTTPQRVWSAMQDAAEGAS